TSATMPIAAKGLTRPDRAEATGVWAVIVSLLLVRHAAEQVELRIRDHPGDVGHAVGQAEEPRDRGDVPGVFVVESVFGQLGVVALVDGPRSEEHTSELQSRF